MQDFAFIIASPERLALIALGIFALGFFSGSEYVSSKLLRVNNPHQPR